jgi:hypothetical protein
LGEEYTHLTLPNGKRKYLYFRKTEVKVSLYSGESLLSKPIEEILHEAERAKITHLAQIEEENKILDGNKHFFDTVSSSSQRNDQLWVEKYSPRNFSQVMLLLFIFLTRISC